MPPTANSQLHPALLDALSSLRRKVKALTVVKGVGLAIAVAVALVLVTIMLDYLLNLPLAARAILLAAAAASVAWVLLTQVIRPLFARLSLGDMAGRLENAFPQFDDRLRSTVDFVRDDVPGSEVLKRMVVEQADKLAASTDFDVALVRKPVYGAVVLGIGAIILALLLSFGFRDFARIAFSRLLLVHSQSWPKHTQIDVVKGAPAKAARDQRFDVRMRLAKGDKSSMRAVAYYRYDNGPVMQQLMTRNSDGTYSVSIDARGNAVKVWLKAGDDETAVQQVNVVQRLDVARVEARITPPPYAKMEPVTFNLKETPAMVTMGSTVQLTLVFNKTLATDKPVIMEPVKQDVKLPAVQWTRPAPGTAIATWVANESLRFRVRAVDSDYFENPGLEEYQISAKPDQNPSVVIENPRGVEDRTNIAVVPLQAQAEDDFDITTMALVVKLERGEEKKQWEIPLKDWFRIDSNAGDRRHFRVKYDWDLAKLEGANLKPGDVLKYHVRVTDNFELNGKHHDPAVSGELKINIISQQTLAQQFTDNMRVVAERVKQALNTQNRNRQETQTLLNETSSKPQLDQGDRTALARLNEQQSTLGSQTRQLAGQVADLERRLNENKSDSQELKDLARDVRSALNDTAQNPMSQASQKLSEAAAHADPKAAKSDPKEQQKQTQQRSEAMQASANNQQQASSQLEKTLAKMGNLSTFENLLQQLREALGQQQDLSKQLSDLGKQTIGKDVNKLTDEQRKKLENIAGEQRKLAEKTEKLTDAMRKGAEQSQKSDPASSKAMQQAAQTSQQQQVASNQSQAAASAQQNQQAQAQSRQKQAELGLQMMLDAMREAERRKLEQLAAELMKLQKAIGELVRRQAGHNIDNLRIQGGDERLKQITDELLGRAERVKDKMPPVPGQDQLTNSQIQTEGNTRDISKDAESVARGGAEISALLTKAAGLMERAIVSLKANQLPAAYDPSQVKALEALVDAKDKADKAAAEVQQQIAEANRETIRQAYEKIRADQEIVNKETVRIDGSPKLPDGSLKREDAVNLGKLPGQQGAIADRAKKMETALQDLGGIVYVWANKDIVDSMNEVKADLAKPATGKPTQAEQQRILDQLDAMIRNLATKPKISEFYGGGGGGGGGGGQQKAKLPSESELRLLKELQIAINKSTKALDQMPEKDKPKLVALGGRQGQLRGLLDQLLQKATRGQAKLDPEPDPKSRLPEEAGEAAVENQELDEQLLGGKISDEQIQDDLKMAAQRMARSRQRLALDNDPGKVTQIIQDRVLQNMDNLIEASRQQLVKSNQPPKPGDQGQQGVKPGEQNAGQQQTGASQQNSAQSPASTEARGGTGNNNADLSKDIREKAAEWGHLTPRERQAVIDGWNDKIIPRYKKITDQYYEAMSKKASQER